MAELDWDDIQGNVLRGYGFEHGHYGVLAVTDAAAGRRWLRDVIPAVTPATPWAVQPVTTLNVAFTHRGLAVLTPDPDALSFPDDFRQGMRARAATHLGDLGVDGPEHWEPAGMHDPQGHVLLLVHATSLDAGEELFSQAVANAEAHGLELLATEQLRNLPNRTEHFGFVDGLSQPAVEGAIEPTIVRGNGTPLEDGSWRPVRAGEFVLGYPDEENGIPVLPGPEVLTRNGSYLVYRKLAQDVAAFRRFVTKESKRHDVSPEVLGAKLVGRHADGSPLTPESSEATERPNPAPPDGHLSARLNDVRYEPDLLGRVCPVGSHIRRANPRDGLGLQPELVSRHRLLRRGMPYGPPLPEGTEDDGVARGLLLLAYCASISRQFEFTQREWLNDGNPFGAGRTADPIAGHGAAERRFAFETPDRSDPSLLSDLPRLVRTRGGGYLFQPSLTGLRYLSGALPPGGSQSRRRRPRKRWIHRDGTVFEATLHPPSDRPAPGSSVHPRPATVRISGTFGLPRPLPEWAGLAIRLCDRDTEGRPTGYLDILLVSSAAKPKLWRQMRPSRDVLGSTFSSVTRYPLGDTHQVVVAIPVEPGSATLQDLRNGDVPCPIRFRLDVAEHRGLWRVLGELELIERREEDDLSLRFTPSRNGLARRAVYKWFQRRS